MAYLATALCYTTALCLIKFYHLITGCQAEISLAIFSDGDTFYNVYLF